MDIQQVRYFLAVAEELHFGRAAERLHITPSPLSRRIRELEQELGRDLFLREHHHVELTPFGDTFRGRAAEAVRVFDALRQLPAEYQEVARCRLGAAPLAPPVVLDLLLDTYRQVSPDTQLPLVLAPSSESLVMLGAERIDLAVVHLPLGTDSAQSLTLAYGPYGVAMRPDDELADRPSLELTDLHDRQVLVTSPKVHPLVMGETRQALLEAGVTRLVHLPHNDTLQIAAHVLRTRALALTVAADNSPGAQIFTAPQFKVTPLRDESLILRVGVAWRPGSEDEVPGLRAVLDALRARYGSRPMRL